MDATKNEPESDFQKNQNSSLQESYEALSIPKASLNQIFSLQKGSKLESWITLKKQADEGSADAQFQLGTCYEEGTGIKKSYKLAYQYYKLAADQGNSGAQISLARLYESGYGVKQSYDKAFKYFKLAADQGNTKAQHQVGWLFMQGKGVDKSDEQSFKYFKMAADQGFAFSQYVVGDAYLKGKSVQKSEIEAFKYFQLAAEQGNIFAENSLAGCFLLGIGAEKSFTEAFKYLTLAANQGYVPSQYWLGKLYFEGKGTEQSHEKAFEYFKLASEQGNKKAQYALGKCYELGQGIKKSHEEAIKYYQLSADQGHRKAKLALSKFDQNIYKENIRQVKQLSKTFIEKPNALQEFAKRLWKSEKEIKEDQLRAEQGDIKAIKQLFNYYHYSQDSLESKKEALKYLRLGIQFNDPECQYFLGLYYEKGYGSLSPSLVEGFKYFNLAAAQGDLAAIKHLKPRILNPYAREVNIQSYLQEGKLSILESILKSYGNLPIFLEIPYFNWEEAQVICNAMIDNPRFTFMCNENELSRLFLAFELNGDCQQKDLNYCRLVNPSTQQETCGCVFIGHDTRDDLLKPVEEPDELERKLLKVAAELEREKKKEAAYEIYLTLPDTEIQYLDSQELDIHAYLEDRNIETLRKIFEIKKEFPIYLRVSGANYQEIAAIREAMIENPRFTFFCTHLDKFSLEESFYQAGYNPIKCLKKKAIKINERKLFGCIFKGQDHSKNRKAA